MNQQHGLAVIVVVVVVVAGPVAVAAGLAVADFDVNHIRRP